MQKYGQYATNIRAKPICSTFNMQNMQNNVQNNVQKKCKICTLCKLWHQYGTICTGGFADVGIGLSLRLSQAAAAGPQPMSWQI